MLSPTCLLASSRLASGQMTTFLLHWTGSLPVSPATVTAIYRFEQVAQEKESITTWHPSETFILKAIKWRRSAMTLDVDISLGLRLRPHEKLVRRHYI